MIYKLRKVGVVDELINDRWIRPEDVLRVWYEDEDGDWFLHTNTHIDFLFESKPHSMYQIQASSKNVTTQELISDLLHTLAVKVRGGELPVSAMKNLEFKVQERTEESSLTTQVRVNLELYDRHGEVIR